MERNFATQFDPMYSPQGESDFQESMTVPDQDYSIRELFQKFTSGHPIQAKIHDAIYDDNPDFDNVIAGIESLDIEDQYDLLTLMRDRIAVLKQIEGSDPVERGILLDEAEKALAAKNTSSDNVSDVTS